MCVQTQKKKQTSSTWTESETTKNSKKNQTTSVDCIRYGASNWNKQHAVNIEGTNHAVTTSDNRIIHRKLIGKPVKTCKQEPSNRGTGPRGPDRRFASKEDKAPTTPRRIPITRRPRVTGNQKVVNYRQREATANQEPYNINTTGKEAQMW